VLQLAKDKDDLPDSAAVSDAFDNAADSVYRQGGFNADDMTNDAARQLLTATAKAIKQGVDSHLPLDVPPTLRYALENNAFIFSGLKTFHALREVGLSMVRDDGSIKSFEEFKDDVKQINQRYNENYLYAEYKHAVGTSQMAAKWVDIEADGDRYDLQYRTAGDDKVRPDHAALNGITLPPSDPFWSKYYPPNGWGCRCTAVQVRVGKYQRSNPADAMQAGDVATDEAKQKMFRYNAGKTMQLFPPKHPYRKVSPATNAVVQQVATQQHQQQRADDMLAELPANLTDAEKQAIVTNCQEIEKLIKKPKGKAMTIEQADEQSANPNYQPKFLPDPNGTYRDSKGNRFSKNPKYKKMYTVNCATCAPAYVLRLRGFNVTAKPKRKNTLNESAANGRSFDMWKNADGTPAQPTTTASWMSSKGYSSMNAQRYRDYFEETCKEQGVYVLTIGWKGGSGHATILQRDTDGKLYYIEPQAYDSAIGAKRPLDELCNGGAAFPIARRGILRVDNKVFDTSWLGLFDY